MSYNVSKNITLEHIKTDNSISGHLLAKDAPNDNCYVSITCLEKIYESTATSFWFAFNEVRAELETIGVIPALAGACENLKMSGMANDMGRGISGYITMHNEYPNSGEMIEIFSDELIGKLATVESQLLFGDDWHNNHPKILALNQPQKAAQIHTNKGWLARLKNRFFSN